MYDAIIIGAGAAGTATALLLARRGYRILVLERSGIPTDKESAHLIQLPGSERLARWGLLDRLAVSGCPPISRLALDLGDAVIVGAPPARGGVRTLYAPERAVLDRLLADAAVEAGAEVRQGCTVKELLWRDGAIAGVQAVDANGRTIIERARIVVGADGRRSLVAQAVHAPIYHARPPLTFIYAATSTGVPVSGVEMTVRDGQTVVAYPTHGDRTRVIVQGRYADHDAFRADIEGNFARALEQAPALAERVQAGQRQGPITGAAELPNYFRQSHGPGWALVGDAGLHIDPTLAHGIAGSFRDAELLTEALAEGFAGRRPMAEALAEYQGRRDAAALPLFGLITRLAAMTPFTPAAADLMRAVAADPAAADSFIGVLCGVVPEAAFFAPEQIGRLMAQAMVAA